MGKEPLTVPAPMPTPRRRRVPKWLLYVAGALVAIVALGSIGGYAYLRRRLPQIEGELKLPGLQTPVNVYRDDWGVPHIVAANTHDLFMAQGFVTAQDRLWQMDLTRRAASGRLAEVMGESQVGTDKFFRSLRLRQAAEESLKSYSATGLDALDAFTTGVNRFIDQATADGKLPLEFTLLGYQPEHWAPVDSAAIGKLMAYDLGGNWPGEVYRYQLRQKVGDQLAQELFPVYPKEGITIMKYQDPATPSTRSSAALPPSGIGVDLSGLLASAVIPDEWNGSNNWVVSGKLTATGKPLLANDPHLGIRTPAIWYETHLVDAADGINVIGVTFPGAPGIVLGHTDKIAWGVTNTGPDVQDLYIEKRNPQNPEEFEFQGKWEKAQVDHQRIVVKGKPDVPYDVTLTRHGPIISEIAGSDGDRPQEALALKWTAHMATPELEAVLMFSRATNWSEFREALKKFQVPTQNFVFASVDGTIAYHAAGIVPIRNKGNGELPVPGWTGEYEWNGFIPFDAMPEVVNPVEGFIVTANNKVVDDRYPYLITTSWAQPYRAQRITDVLSRHSKIQPEEMRLLQVDYANLQAESLLPILLPALKNAKLTEPETSARAMLENWDHVDRADQPQPLAYQLWWKHLTKMLYEPQMGPDLFKRMADQGNVTDELLRKAAKGEPGAWIKAAGGLEPLALASFQAAIKEGSKLQGSNPLAWQWGTFHHFAPEHPIGGAVKALGLLLNPKSYPVGGSGLTVGAMSFDRETGAVTSAAPWRHVVDLSNLETGSADALNPGQSGNVTSKWYDDQLAFHVRGALRPQRFKSSDYQQGNRLLLQP